LSSLEAELENLVSGNLSFRNRSRQQIEQMAFTGNPRSSATWWARQSLAYPDNRRSLHYEVQAWRLGDLTAIALEGEVCADWGPMVRALVTTRHAMAIAYANEVPGYIPTARIIREGGYEGDTSHMAYFLPAPFQPKMEIEPTALLSWLWGGAITERAKAHRPRTRRICWPFRISVTRMSPATTAEELAMKRTRVLAADKWPGRKAAIVANLRRLLWHLPGPPFAGRSMKIVKEEPRDGYTEDHSSQRRSV
jgi:hypothetical protein